MKAKQWKQDHGNQKPAYRLAFVIKLFFFSAFLLISLNGDIEWEGILLAVLVPFLIHVATLWIPKLFPADRLLMTIVNFLCALGILVLYVTDRSAGNTRGLQQAINYIVGLAAMILCIVAVRTISKWRIAAPAMLVGTCGLLLLPLVFGKEFNGATNWILIGGLSMQPSEICKISFLLVLGYYMSEHKLLPWLALAGFTLLALMLQKDLGTALVFYAGALFMFYASTGSFVWTGIGVLGGCSAAVVGYQMFAHVKKRVAIWQNPWRYSDTSGYQIVQALMAIASGGWFGVGLGLGTPRVIPIYYADCIFAVICEQFGVIFGALVILMYVILLARCASIATQARSSFFGLVAIGATVMLGIQTFVIIGGVLKMIPLTGVTMPFVSYGGTSLVSCMGLIGLLQGICSVTRDELAYDYEISTAIQEMNGQPYADGGMNP